MTRRRVSSVGGCLQSAGLIFLALVTGVLGFLPLAPVLFIGPVNIAQWGAVNFAEVGLTLGIYLVCGAAIGFLKPGSWMIAALLAWLCVFLSLYNLALAPSTPEVQKAIPLALVILVLPLVFSLGGAYLGRNWRQRRARDTSSVRA